MKLRTSSFGMPSPSRVKSEDAFAVTHGADGGVLCVLSDGVSAARDPRRCAERVVRLVSESFEARPLGWSPRQTLERLAGEANASLHREGAYHDGVPSMQATLAAFHIAANHLSGINVGDSPVLLVRDGFAERISTEDTMRNGDGRDILTASIGRNDAVSPHYFERELQQGDLVLAVSDGVTEVLDDAELGRLTTRLRSARLLTLEAARLSTTPGKLDDLSVILVEVEEVDPAVVSPASRATHPFPRPARGDVFDGYVLRRTMANNPRVWLADKNGARFVVKFAPAEAERDELVAARFAREAWNASRFDCEFFVRAVLPGDGSPHFYAMEYLEAPSLSFLLKSRRLAAEEVVELGRFLARAGQWLLRRELIHGDVKPDNILVHRTGDGLGFKLLDLGIASPVFTDIGVAGTATYLAPERFQGAVITERTEIFAIGATLYEMLASRPPHGRIERFQNPVFKKPPPPSRFNPNVPAWLDAVILRCLSLRQTDRYQHFSELLYALDHPEEAPVVSRFDGLLTRDPLLFYKSGFWLLLAAAVALLLTLLAQ